MRVRPAPVSQRRGKVSTSSRVPVAAAIRPAASTPAALSAGPPSSSVAPGARTASAAAATREASGGIGPATGSGGASDAPSDQDTSAGSTSVATCPPRSPVAARARMASAATSRTSPLVCTHPETVRATAVMSDCSGASNRTWSVACPPTTHSSGIPARRALCRFANPLPSPGPRCSSTAAGFPAMGA